ncbi:hypothetical protein [Burkholderia sp. BCC1993]|uniref:hypothetical protein n=1 Tax=Burkholderia sp. BCC1993 TaxID=2817444 RepID=UPI002AB01A7D|nr:hypothetical protein [Burkholderia sp. BCC1993]
MRKLATIALVLALVPMTAFGASGSEPSATILMTRIANEGGHKVLWDLWEHEEDFDHVLSGVESGDASWLKVAIALRPFADAGASLSLDYAVARALPKAPNRVLALVGHGFALELICTSPFIEPEPGVAEAYERKTLVALSRVKSPALVPIATECSKRVRLPGRANLPAGRRQPLSSKLSAPGDN